MATVSVRYIVNDVDAAIDFYCQQLDFHESMHPAPTFAMLSHGDLRLVLSAPGGGPGGGQAMADGTAPEPGAGTASSLRSTISKPPSRGSVSMTPGFATTSPPESAASRYSWKTRPAIRSSFSSRSLTRRSSQQPPEPLWQAQSGSHSHEYVH